MICDFCSSHAIRWSYPALSFDVPQALYTSVGEWAACDHCHALIEARDQAGLAKRSCDTFPYPASEEIKQEAIGILHAEFWRCRSGEAERI